MSLTQTTVSTNGLGVVMGADRMWYQVAAQFVETPHRGVGNLPAGGNRLFIDGHADWVNLPRTTNRVHVAAVEVNLFW